MQVVLCVRTVVPETHIFHVEPAYPHASKTSMGKQQLILEALEEDNDGSLHVVYFPVLVRRVFPTHANVKITRHLILQQSRQYNRQHNGASLRLNNECNKVQ